MEKFENDFVKAFLKMEIEQGHLATFNAQEIHAMKRYGKFLDENLTFDSGEWKTIPEALGDYKEAHGKERS